MDRDTGIKCPARIPTEIEKGDVEGRIVGGGDIELVDGHRFGDGRCVEGVDEKVEIGGIGIYLEIVDGVRLLVEEGDEGGGGAAAGVGVGGADGAGGVAVVEGDGGDDGIGAVW